MVVLSTGNRQEHVASELCERRQQQIDDALLGVQAREKQQQQTIARLRALIAEPSRFKPSVPSIVPDAKGNHFDGSCHSEPEHLALLIGACDVKSCRVTYVAPLPQPPVNQLFPFGLPPRVVRKHSAGTNNVRDARATRRPARSV